MENLIVKVGKYLSTTEKIPGSVINRWKTYTLFYFQQSPNTFLIDTNFYNILSTNMKVNLVKRNLMLHFQEKFDILFKDPEFGFKADEKLVSQIISSLSYEHFEPGENIMKLNMIC